MWKPPEDMPTPPWFPALKAVSGGRFPENAAVLSERVERVCRDGLADGDQIPLEVDGRLAGRRIRIRVGGNAAAENIAAPFAHLRSAEPPAGEIALHIEFLYLSDTWFPGPGLSSGRQEPRWFDTIEKSPDRRHVVNMRPNTLACLDRLKGRISALGLWQRTNFLYETAKPLASLLAEWHNDQGVPITHGGLVALGEKGVLLGGMSGSGKSTAALACLLGGFDFLGEDFTAIERLEEGKYRGHSVYSSVFLETEHLKTFTDFAHRIVQKGGAFEEKSALLLSRCCPDRLRASVAIRAVAVCRVGPGRQTSIRPLERSKALLALAPTCMFQVPSAPRRAFERVARLVQELPVFELETGHDLRTIAPALARAVERL